MVDHPKPITPRVGTGVAFFLVGASLALAAPEEAPTTFWERHGKVEEEAPASTTATGYRPQGPIEQTPLTLATLRIPTQHGSLKREHSAREPIIIHIQDAHANYEAQKHLAAILEHLILSHALSLVLVEGGSRNDSLSYMRTYAPLQKRREVAEEFLKAGKISGENYLDLTSDYDFTVYGIERPELYDENMEAFFSVERVQKTALTAIAGFQEAVTTLKAQLYPQSVLDLEAKEQEVKAGAIPLAHHYEQLSNEAKGAGVKVEGKALPNFMRFLNALRLEREMDFKAVEVERTKFLESLTRTLPKPEMDSLLNQSLELKRGLITPASFYGHLKSYFKPEAQGDYPVLTRYIQYLELFDGIDHAALFTEVETLSDKIKMSYLDNRSQKKLFQVAKDVGILADLLDLKLTPDAYEYYRTHKREFKPDRWADTLRDLGKRRNPKLTFALTPGPLNAAMPAMSSFYEVARKRDEAMVANALKQIEAFDVPFAVLIAGGFHTPVFERLFEKRKVSYAVVAPKVGKVTPADTEKYHRVLKETYVPMSEKYRKKMGVPLVAAPLRAARETEPISATGIDLRPPTSSEGVAVAFAPEE